MGKVAKAGKLVTLPILTIAMSLYTSDRLFLKYLKSDFCIIVKHLSKWSLKRVHFHRILLKFPICQYDIHKDRSGQQKLVKVLYLQYLFAKMRKLSHNIIL